MPVTIKGNEYTTVAERLIAIHKKEGSKLSILTEILSEDDIGITMKARIKISGDDPQQFEGHARELYSSNRNEVNFAFSLENCETSAIGRALASAGYAGNKFSSAEEMDSIDRKNDARESQIKAGIQAKAKTKTKVKAKPDDELDDESPISKLRSELKEKRESLKWSSQKIMELVDDEFKVSNWKNLTVDHIKWLIIQCDMASKAKEDDTSEVAL